MTESSEKDQNGSKAVRDENETVIVELPGECRLRLCNQILERMHKKGITAYDWAALHLGFELPPGWPVDGNAQPTLAQLVVMAHKLGMQIVIDDLNIIPRKEQEKKE